VEPVGGRPSRSRARIKVITYTKYDLPFPRNRATKMVAIWSKRYMACLYDWVATLDNPWQANSDPLFATKVKETWIFIFPDLAHEVDHPAIEFLVCLSVASQSLVSECNPLIFLGWRQHSLLAEQDRLQCPRCHQCSIQRPEPRSCGRSD
jgi:hypothetical protein